MTLAYWGDNASGKRWLMRIYRNDLQLQLNGPTRRSFTKNLNDGVWHHLAASPQKEVGIAMTFACSSMAKRLKFMDNGELEIIWILDPQLTSQWEEMGSMAKIRG